MLSTRTLSSALLALSLSLLAACSSAPQATDPIDDLAALADANGDLEATLSIVSVVPSSAPSTAQVLGNDVSYQYTYQKITWTYRGKTGNGFSLSSSTPGSQVAAAVAAGDQMRIRGRVRKVGNVPAFVGFMHSPTTQASGIGAAAATPPTPVILVAEGKTLSGIQVGLMYELKDVLVSSYAIEINGQTAGWFRTANGSTASFRVTSPGPLNLPSGVFQARLSGRIEVVQTSIGPVGNLTGVLAFGQNQSVQIQGIAGATEIAAKD
ncbi:MAG: hypothetical protein SFU83_16595 [Meiothermus sp.]|nr:hypothetical protein [Meiothermus sp.]